MTDRKISGGYMTENFGSGDFTLPGESGYEELTLQMAEKWGADVIRDSDGTTLSDEIMNAGYGIYSTICIIRDHNEWAAENLDKLQQCFLITNPLVAVTKVLTISLLKDFFKEQFRINDSAQSIEYWQVYDRTVNQEISRDLWNYDGETGQVIISNALPWHKYTVSFIAYRIWEEISMYNHTTNHWMKEHLMQLDPAHVEVQNYLVDWLEKWCLEHEQTTVVRFTSLFYNFTWIWGSSERNRYLFSDWGSYDFTISPFALNQFASKYGYRLTAEDFVNQGKYRVSHSFVNQRKADWMEYMNDFVIEFGRKLVDIVHNHGKKAYVFYDDSWIGLEPYNDRFKEFHFDGLIKCVFSGYEVRLCSDVKVETHELRLHPYLFPVGLGGTPTFMEGGNPAIEARKFWISVRRALLRTPIERIGLGGYLHLIEQYPDFCDYIENVANEFRFIKSLHHAGKPYVISPRVAVLHSWGKLRSWTLSGHFHETYMHDLIHVNEALSGLPVDVTFINFEDVQNGALDQIDIVINAGTAGSAWSGGESWSNNSVVEELTRWVYEGGVFIGINQPSAISGYDTYFRMAHVLGVDEDTGERVCHGRWTYELERIEGLLPVDCKIESKEGIYLCDGAAKVISEKEGIPTLTMNSFGEGVGVYLSRFEISPENTRMLLNLLLYFSGNDFQGNYITDNAHVECTYYPDSQVLVIINNSDSTQVASIHTEFGIVTVSLSEYESKKIIMNGD